MVWLVYGGGKVKRRMPSWLAVVVILLVIIYTIFTGASPSVVRAAIMGSVLLLGPTLGRRYDPIAALAVSAAIMVAVDPNLLADAGFQLSFLAMLGIALLSPRLFSLCRVPSGWVRLPPLFAYPLSAGLGASLATFPVVALLSGQFSLVAPFATLTADFALPVLMISGIITVIVGALGASAAALPGLAVTLSAWWLVTNAQLWSALPWAAVDVGGINVVQVFIYYAGLLVGVLALSRRRHFVGIAQRLFPTRKEMRPGLGTALLAVGAVAVWTIALFLIIS